jgi:hypothetical protein
VSRPTPGPDLLALIDQAREATRELRVTLKDVKTAQREAEEGIAKLMQDAVVDHLDTIVKRETAEMGAQFKEGTDRAVERIQQVCNQLLETYMRGEARNSASLDEVMAARQVLRKWNAEKRGNGQ